MSMTSHSTMHQILTDALTSRGFTVERPLKTSVQSAILCVHESAVPEASRITYVAKAVSLNGLEAQGRAAALQEVSVLRGIPAHPNLIEYRDSFLEEAAGVLLIVMSFAESGDLRGVVANTQKSCKTLPEPAVLFWMLQMLSGLQHLHNHGVVHRDLKSSNIFLSESRRRIRIGDFGISRVLESTAFATSCVGTPAYMSPELMRNEKYDYHVDVWAFGCICYELCTLHLPFVAKSLLDLVYTVVEANPDWSLWDRTFSDELKQVAQSALSKDAANRPTATQMLALPLFAPGGRGSMPPADDIWESVPDGTDFDSSLSQILEGSNDGSGTWASTPHTELWQSGNLSLNATDTSISQVSLATGSTTKLPPVQASQELN